MSCRYDWFIPHNHFSSDYYQSIILYKAISVSAGSGERQANCHDATLCMWGGNFTSYHRSSNKELADTVVSPSWPSLSFYTSHAVALFYKAHVVCINSDTESSVWISYSFSSEFISYRVRLCHFFSSCSVIHSAIIEHFFVTNIQLGYRDSILNNPDLRQEVISFLLVYQ